MKMTRSWHWQKWCQRLTEIRSISDDNLEEAPGYSTGRVDIALAKHQEVMSTLQSKEAKKAAMKAGREVLMEANK